MAYPRYIAGENPAPPEDCGGIPGFYAQLEAHAEPNHRDHEDAKEWFGDFDPNRFDEQPIKNRPRPYRKPPPDQAKNDYRRPQPREGARALGNARPR